MQSETRHDPSVNPGQQVFPWAPTRMVRHRTLKDVQALHHAGRYRLGAALLTPEGDEPTILRFATSAARESAHDATAWPTRAARDWVGVVELIVEQACLHVLRGGVHKPFRSSLWDLSVAYFERAHRWVSAQTVTKIVRRAVELGLLGYTRGARRRTRDGRTIVAPGTFRVPAFDALLLAGHAKTRRAGSPDNARPLRSAKPKPSERDTDRVATRARPVGAKKLARLAAAEERLQAVAEEELGETGSHDHEIEAIEEQFGAPLPARTRVSARLLLELMTLRQGDRFDAWFAEQLDDERWSSDRMWNIEGWFHAALRKQLFEYRAHRDEGWLTGEVAA